MNLFWLKTTASVVILCCHCSQQLKAKQITFNSDLLNAKEKRNIDLSNFSEVGYIIPNKYSMLIKVNDKVIEETEIEWVSTNESDTLSKPCLSVKLTEKLGLKKNIKSKLSWTPDKQCLELSSLPGINVKGDLASSELNITIPKIYVEYSSEYWDPPSIWDNGINGVLFDYYINAHSYKENGQASDNFLNSNGTTGFNVGAWRFRADWQAEKNINGSDDSHWDWNRYYAYRPIPSIGAKLAMGENNFQSNIFDGFSLTGFMISTDDNMLPPNLRGYAPEISGVARTNARVIISQKGRILQETLVPQGFFRIVDLNDMASGVVDVKIEEQDGSVQTYSVNVASAPFLARPGSLRYKSAIGKPSDTNHNIIGPLLMISEISLGLRDLWSLYGGTIVSQDYLSPAIGLGRDFHEFGAFSFDIIHSYAEIKGRRINGESVRINYVKKILDTDSDFTISSQRFSDKDFTSMNDFVNFNNGYERENDDRYINTISFNQHFKESNASSYLNYSHHSFWDSKSEERYALTLSKYFDFKSYKNMSLSATIFLNDFDGGHDEGMYMFLSIPVGRNSSIGYNGSVNNTSSSQKISYYGKNNYFDDYQLGVGYSDEGAYFDSFVNKSTSAINYNSSISYMEGQYLSADVSLQGAISVAGQGIVFHQNNMPGGSRVMIDTMGVKDIPLVSDNISTKTNKVGLAVISDMSSYTRKNINLDLNEMPINAEAQHSITNVTLTEGAIGYRSFDIIDGEKSMAQLILSDGKHPPLGATVKNKRGQNVGIVSNDGIVYLYGMKENEIMNVLWKDGGCKIRLPVKFVLPNTSNLLLSCLS